MKTSIKLIPLAAALLPVASAGTALVDFNNSVPAISVANYNNLSISNTAVTAIGPVGSPLALNEITTGTPTGWSMTLTKLNAIGDVASTGTGANYAGPYPAAVSGYATTAVSDSIFVNNLGELEVKFTGLNPAKAYDLLGYAARGNNAGVGTFDLTVGTLGSGGDSDPLTIHAFNDKATDTSVIDWQDIVPNASGEIAFKIASLSNAAGANTTGINFISLDEVSPPPVLVWNNAAANGLWDAVSANWFNGTGNQAFSNGEDIRFQDTAGTTENISVTGTHTPDQMLFTNLATDFVFSGSGTISGTGAMNVNAGGYVTFNNTGGLAFSGPLALTASSRVILGTTAAHGSTSIAAGSTLELSDGASVSSPVANNGSVLDESDTGTVTLSGVLSGAGTLTKNGTSTLSLTADNTATGTVTLNAGTFVLDKASGAQLYKTGAFFGTQNQNYIFINTGGTLETWNWNYNTTLALSELRHNYGQILLNGGTIRFDDTFSSQRAFTVGAGGGTLEVTAGNSYTKLAGNLGGENIIRFSANSTLTIAGAGNAVIGDALGAYGSTGFNLAKSGAGTLTLSGANSYTGDTTVNNGTLHLVAAGGLNFVIGATSGTNNSLSGAGTAILDGSFTINTTAASALTTGTWTLENVPSLTGAYGATFSVVGFTNAGSDKWTLTDGSKLWTFDETTGVLTLSANNTYATWATANAGGGAAAQDFDQDGVSNGVEFFMGQTGSSFTPNPSLLGGTVTWPKNPSAIATYVVQTSTNLQNEIAPGDGGWSTVPSGVVDNGTSVTYTPPTGDPKRFTRINVTIP